MSVPSYPWRPSRNPAATCPEPSPDDNSRQGADGPRLRRWPRPPAPRSPASCQKPRSGRSRAGATSCRGCSGQRAVDQMQGVGVPRAVRQVGAAPVRQLPMQQDQSTLPRGQRHQALGRQGRRIERHHVRASALRARSAAATAADARRAPPTCSHSPRSHPRAPARSRRSSAARCAGRCCPGGRRPRRRSAAA